MFNYYKKPPSQRQLKIARNAEKVILKTVFQYEMPIIVNAVILTADLKEIFIYFSGSATNNISINDLAKLLNDNQAQWRKIISQELQLKVAPKVSFRINKILN